MRGAGRALRGAQGDGAAMAGGPGLPSLEELEVPEVSERPRGAALGPRPASIAALLRCTAGESQLGRAEGRGPPLRLAVRPAQQGVHAVPLGGEGPAALPARGPPGQPVRPRLLQVSRPAAPSRGLAAAARLLEARPVPLRKGRSRWRKGCAVILFFARLNLGLCFPSELRGLSCRVSGSRDLSG